MDEAFERMPVSGGMGLHAQEGSLKYQIDSDDIIEELRHSLKNEFLVWNEHKGVAEWQQMEDVPPLLNNKGVGKIMTILKSRLTKIFILSDLHEDVIENITTTIGQTLIDDLRNNWEEYEIKDDAASSTILHLVCDTVYATMMKAKEAKYLKFLSTTTNVQEVATRQIRDTQQPDQHDTIMGKIFGRRKR